jgi:CHAD domain-containing protein
LRRAAGAARDWDVFLLGLEQRREKQPEKEQHGLNFLFAYGFGLRTAAQADLEAAGAEEHPSFDAFLEATAAAIRPAPELPDGATLHHLAHPLLTARLHELDWTAAGDLQDYAHLHQVRIAGKRLRYAMEVFADCFSLSFREKLYPRVEEMQEILGRANDSHVAEGRLADLRRHLRHGWPVEWKRVQPGLEGLLRFHQRRLPQERKRFLQWRHEWNTSGAPALTALLGGNSAQSNATAAEESKTVWSDPVM